MKSPHIVFFKLAFSGIKIYNKEKLFFRIDMLLSEIKNLCDHDYIEVTMHMLQRMTTRRISLSEVKEAIQNGEIIEEYPDDYPYPSCLVIGYTIRNRILHVVLGIGESRLWMITVYEPDPEAWNHDYKHRRES